MVLMSRAGPRVALRQWLVPVLVMVSALTGCQSTGQSVSGGAHVEGWRVVERLGDARYLAADASGWAPAGTPTAIPPGSEVVTGFGGRLILAHAGHHLSVGPGSRFTLPQQDREALEQTVGTVRYRISPGTGEPFVVVTPYLQVEVLGTIFEVAVSAAATEVTVEKGRLRIATPDGTRQTQLEAGQSAYAGRDATAQLAIRRTPGGPLEPIEPVIVPAMLPKAEHRAIAAHSGRPPIAAGFAPAGDPAAATGAASRTERGASPGARAATSGMARRAAAEASEATEVQPEILGHPTGMPPAVVTPPATVDAPPANPSRDPSAVQSQSNPPAVSREIDVAEDAARRQFERLTEGILNSLPAAPPLDYRPADVRS